MIKTGTPEQKVTVPVDGQTPILEGSGLKQGPREHGASGDVVLAVGQGAPVVVSKGCEPPTIAELAAARKGQTLPVKHVEAPITALLKPNLDAKVRSFFAAYENSDPKAMRAMLAAKTVYEDPVFPHLEDEQVGRMWSAVAGGSTKVKPQIDRLEVGEHGAEVDWVARYKFLGASIANHIHSSFAFDSEGKITRQKDTFDWRAWGSQTPFPLNLLLRTGLGQRLVQWFLGRQVGS